MQVVGIKNGMVIEVLESYYRNMQKIQNGGKRLQNILISIKAAMSGIGQKVA